MHLSVSLLSLPRLPHLNNYTSCYMLYGSMEFRLAREDFPPSQVNSSAGGIAWIVFSCSWLFGAFFPCIKYASCKCYVAAATATCQKGPCFLRALPKGEGRAGLFKITISLILMKRSSSSAKNKITWPRRSSSYAMTRSILRSRSRSLISYFLRLLIIIFWNLGTFLNKYIYPCSRKR